MHDSGTFLCAQVAGKYSYTGTKKEKIVWIIEVNVKGREADSPRIFVCHLDLRLSLRRNAKEIYQLVGHSRVSHLKL